MTGFGKLNVIAFAHVVIFKCLLSRLTPSVAISAFNEIASESPRGMRKFNVR